MKHVECVLNAAGGLGGAVRPPAGPWQSPFSIVANVKNNAQEDYNGYKKAFGWYKVVIVKVGIEATC